MRKIIIIFILVLPSLFVFAQNKKWGIVESNGRLTGYGLFNSKYDCERELENKKKWAREKAQSLQKNVFDRTDPRVIDVSRNEINNTMRQLSAMFDNCKCQEITITEDANSENNYSGNTNSYQESFDIGDSYKGQAEKLSEGIDVSKYETNVNGTAFFAGLPPQKEIPVAPTINTGGAEEFELPEEKEDELPTIIIGEYEKKPVYKKGDTILVAANNKKYLLSKQSVMAADGYTYELGLYISRGSFIIETDLHGRKEAIGYITTQTQMPNSSRYGAIEEYAKMSVGHKFYELDCSEEKQQYEKFKTYSKNQITRMDNTIKVFSKSYNDYEKIINDDIELNNRIVLSKLSDIAIQITSDLIDSKIESKIKGLGTNAKTKDIADILEEYHINSNTSLQSYLTEKVTDIWIAPLKLTGEKNFELVQDVKNCASSIVLMAFNSMDDKDKVDYKKISLAEFLKDKVRSKDHNLLETETARIIKTTRDVIDGCIPSKLSYTLKKCWMYHALKNAPEAGEAIGISAANMTIKYSIKPETKKMFTDHISCCQQKKNLLLRLEQEYSRKISNNKEHCRGYFDAMRDLYERTKNPVEDNCISKELKNIHKVIFGDGKIIEVKPIINEEKITNFTSTEKASRQDIIGYYNENIPVYFSNKVIFIENKEYLLGFQPWQYAFNNKFTKYKGNIKARFFIMYDGKSLPQDNDFRNENIIGWVDWDYKNTYTFTQRKGDRVEGVNLFGSIYIGPNNPTYPDGQRPIYTLPWQDNVDAAALEHDTCYAQKGAADLKDALLNIGVTDCDTELVMRCLATLQIHVEDNMTQNAIDLIKNKLDWSKSSVINNITNLTDHEQITDPIQRAKYVATFFLAASSGKGWGLIFNTINSIKKEK